MGQSQGRKWGKESQLPFWRVLCLNCNLLLSLAMKIPLSRWWQRPLLKEAQWDATSISLLNIHSFMQKKTQPKRVCFETAECKSSPTYTFTQVKQAETFPFSLVIVLLPGWLVIWFFFFFRNIKIKFFWPVCTLYSNINALLEWQAGRTLSWDTALAAHKQSYLYRLWANCKKREKTKNILMGTSIFNKNHILIE